MVTIRQYRTDYVYKTPKLYAQLYRLTLKTDPKSGFTSSFRLSLDARASGFIFVAYSKGRAIGWAFVTRRWLTSTTNSYQVGVYVKPQWRRHGIGRRLVEKSHILVKKHLKKSLYAVPWNAAGRKLYAKFNIPTAPTWKV